MRPSIRAGQSTGATQAERVVWDPFVIHPGRRRQMWGTPRSLNAALPALRPGHG